MHRLGKRVVRDACEWDRLSRVELLHSWSGQRQTWTSIPAASRFAILPSPVSQELVDQPGKSGRHLRVHPDCFGLLFDLAAGTIHERGRRVMLFKGDGAHFIPFIPRGVDLATSIDHLCPLQWRRLRPSASVLAAVPLRKGSLGCVVHQARA